MAPRMWTTITVTSASSPALWTSTATAPTSSTPTTPTRTAALLAEHIVSEGVTSFLATTITQSVEVLTNAVTNVANVMESGYDGAEILGIHFEGPYLDMKYKGAQPDQYIVKPTIEQFEHYQKAARGHIRYVTLATEHDETSPSPAI